MTQRIIYFKNNLITKKMDELFELKTLVISLEEDAKKYYNKGDKNAGARISIAMDKVKLMADKVQNNYKSKKP
jgi:hypothetical protein